MLRSIMIRHRRWLTFTYSLMLVEFTAFAMMPWLLGRAVDGLLARRSEDFVLYLGLSGFGFLLGFCRRRLDTRVFMRVWQERALDGVEGMRRAGVEPSKIVSRYRMTGIYAEFFEFTLPTAIAAAVDIAVATVMIWLATGWPGLVVAILVCTVLSFNYGLSVLVKRCEAALQVCREDVDRALLLGDGVQGHFDGYRYTIVRRSDLDACCWGFNDLMAMVAEALLVFTAAWSGQSVGTIMATLAYASKLFQRTGVTQFFFNHLRQVELVNGLLAEVADGVEEKVAQDSEAGRLQLLRLQPAPGAEENQNFVEAGK